MGKKYNIQIGKIWREFIFKGLFISVESDVEEPQDTQEPGIGVGMVLQPPEEKSVT